MPPTLLLFLKAPRSGFVKTRLARDIGDAEAVRWYRELVARQLARLPHGWRVEVRFTPDDAENEMRRWLGDDLALRTQGPGDLGERLARTFADAFHGGALRVFAIGADCPGLEADDLERAMRALDQSDVVLGPAADGGYYLIGLRRNASFVFAEIPWGTSEVLNATLLRAHEAALSVALLDVKEDIDDRESLERFRRSYKAREAL